MDDLGRLVRNRISVVTMCNRLAGHYKRNGNGQPREINRMFILKRDQYLARAPTCIQYACTTPSGHASDYHYAID